jgi:hypothetical protein
MTPLTPQPPVRRTHSIFFALAIVCFVIVATCALAWLGYCASVEAGTGIEPARRSPGAAIMCVIFLVAGAFAWRNRFNKMT